VPCIELCYLTEAQRKAYVIADNKLALNAGWDGQLLTIELKGLGELGFDLGLTGVGELGLGALFASEKTDGLTDPDEAPEPRQGRQALRLLDDGLLAATRHLAPVYDLYRRRIAQFQIEAPPQNWDGVFTAEEK
jgi:hypothetical protein